LISNYFKNLTALISVYGWLGGELYFKGIIDDVRIYNKALTPSKIADLAQE
jgi:hypothetical protein